LAFAFDLDLTPGGSLQIIGIFTAALTAFTTSEAASTSWPNTSPYRAEVSPLPTTSWSEPGPEQQKLSSSAPAPAFS
jgi:hypothetical protein